MCYDLSDAEGEYEMYDGAIGFFVFLHRIGQSVNAVRTFYG